jgi:hypothetical protein
VGSDAAMGEETTKDRIEMETQDEEWIMAQGLDNRRKSKKRSQVQATRQSLRLKSQGGVSIEETTTRRKQKQNLDSSGTK